MWNDVGNSLRSKMWNDVGNSLRSKMWNDVGELANAEKCGMTWGNSLTLKNVE